MGPSTPLGAIRSPKVCEAHPDVRSTSLLGESGGIPPQENFEFYGCSEVFFGTFWSWNGAC